MGTYDGTHRAIRKDGTEVKIGDTVTSFRGEAWIFRGITRVPGDGSATTGKVTVTSDRFSAEYYAHVFDLTIQERTEDTVNFSFALAVDLARMGLWPSDVRFSEPTPEPVPVPAYTSPYGTHEPYPAHERDDDEFSYASPEEQYADPAYEAYQAELDRMCNRAYVMGPVHDPSATYCDLDTGHSGKHEGDSPFDDGRIQWCGGGSIEGDPLPVTGVHFVQAGAQR